jgi:hypothetical protein
VTKESLADSFPSMTEMVGSDVCILLGAFPDAKVSDEAVVGWRAEVLEMKSDGMTSITIRVFDKYWFELFRTDHVHPICPESATEPPSQPPAEPTSIPTTATTAIPQGKQRARQETQRWARKAHRQEEAGVGKVLAAAANASPLIESSNSPPRESTVASEPEVTMSFLQCDKCDKWRVVKKRESEAYGRDGIAWNCTMNEDKDKNCCEAAEEDFGDELDGQEVPLEESAAFAAACSPDLACRGGCDFGPAGGDSNHRDRGKGLTLCDLFRVPKNSELPKSLGSGDDLYRLLFNPMWKAADTPTEPDNKRRRRSHRAPECADPNWHGAGVHGQASKVCVSKIPILNF